MLARAFIADAVADLGGRLIGRESAWGVDAATLAAGPARSSRPTAPRRSSQPVAATLAAVRHRARGTCPTSSSSRPRRSTASPTTRSARSPSTSTAPTPTSPRTSSPASPSSAASGSRYPRSTAGSRAGGEADYLGMVVATEELSWGSLGVGGSLITRPEILTRAILAGGTEEQKQRWLPRIAAGRAHGGRDGHRARLRLRRRRHHHDGHARSTAGTASTA